MVKKCSVVILHATLLNTLFFAAGQIFVCFSLLRDQTHALHSLSVEMTQRNVPGFAIGGLSGGEEKDDFWRMVTLSTDHLPRGKPRYLMGVGYVCSIAVKFLL